MAVAGYLFFHYFVPSEHIPCVYVTDRPGHTTCLPADYPTVREWMKIHPGQLMDDGTPYDPDWRQHRASNSPTVKAEPTSASDGQSYGASSSDMVRKETYALIRATNLPNETSLSYLHDKYADQVSYYGKYFSRDEVITDKRNFFLRWPNRNYTIDPGSLVVGCQSASSCRADGTFTWSDIGNGLSSLGSATFSFGWSLEEGGTWRINLETSQVLKRQVLRSERASPTLPPVGASISPSYR
jgi:hypothetical protein